MVKKYLIPAGALIAALIAYQYQSPTDNTQKEAILAHIPSNNPDELNKLVRIDTKITNLKWELFGTPEWSDTTPSPTDFATIIITGELSNQKSSQKSNIEEANYFIPPNSKRNWLNQEQSTIIASLIDGKTPLPPAHCAMRTFKSSSGSKDLEGIDCRHNGSALMMILLIQPSG